MVKKGYDEFLIKHSLVNRIYHMLDYFRFFKDTNRIHNQIEVRKDIQDKLKTLAGIETFAKYFDDKKKKHRNDVELWCTLTDLITDLNFLKLYIIE